MSEDHFKCRVYVEFNKEAGLMSYRLAQFTEDLNRNTPVCIVAGRFESRELCVDVVVRNYDIIEQSITRVAMALGMSIQTHQSVGFDPSLAPDGCISVQRYSLG